MLLNFNNKARCHYYPAPEVLQLSSELHDIGVGGKAPAYVTILLTESLCDYLN